MGTYDTSGGSAASPPAEDERCDFCERDPQDCQCSPEVLNNFRTERAFMEAVKDVPPRAVVRAVNAMSIGVDFNGCGKGSIASHWADDTHHNPFKGHGRERYLTLGYIRRTSIAAMLPHERVTYGRRRDAREDQERRAAAAATALPSSRVTPRRRDGRKP